MRSTGSPDDETLIDAKWESLALAPVGDPVFPDDYFLITAVRVPQLSWGVPSDVADILVGQ